MKGPCAADSAPLTWKEVQEALLSQDRSGQMPPRSDGKIPAGPANDPFYRRSPPQPKT
jgi:hypothetical protein